jgi:hypothetical protein
MREDSLRAVWGHELDRLEVDVVRAERILKGLETMPAEPWTPPAVPGQMPADLAERAQDLLDRQERALADLRDALAEAQRQLGYAGRVSDAVAPGAARPVYVDIEA